MNFKSLFLFQLSAVLLTFPLSEDTKLLIDKAEKAAKNVSINATIPEWSLNNGTKEIIKGIKQKALEIRKFFRRAQNGTLSFDYSAYINYIKHKQDRRIERKVMNGTVYIAMSSSVPKKVWQRYICYVENNKLRAVFVLRGFIGGIKSGIKPTLKYVRSLIDGWSCPGKTQTVHKVEIDIDPWIFRKYGINRVPAVIYKGKVSYGDWSLDWHLEKLKGN